MIEKILNDKEYIDIVRDILDSLEFNKRKNYKHHDEISVYDHSLFVSYYSYKLAKKIRTNYKNAAIAGLLHDFYYEDWHVYVKKPFFKQHGFTHAKEALTNSKNYFNYLLNKRIENAILRHMFPLNIIPPLYVEGWIVTIIDKRVSMEIFKKPNKLNEYIGLKKKR